MSRAIHRAKHIVLALLIAAVGLWAFAAGPRSIVPEADAYSSYCLTHFGTMSGPNWNQRHTTGNMQSDGRKLTIIETAGPGYWYISGYVRAYCA